MPESDEALRREMLALQGIEEHVPPPPPPNDWEAVSGAAIGGAPEIRAEGHGSFAVGPASEGITAASSVTPIELSMTLTGSGGTVEAAPVEGMLRLDEGGNIYCYSSGAWICVGALSQVSEP